MEEGNVIICPYCRDRKAGDKYPQEDGLFIPIVTCTDCGKNFKLLIEVDVTYYTEEMESNNLDSQY